MKKNYIKAGAENKRLIKNIVIMTVVAAADAFGILLFLYNIVNFNIVFCIIAFIGVFIGTAALVINFNTFFTKYISLDDENIYIKNWENGFFSYDILNAPLIIREFVPAKTQTTIISAKEIKRVLIGTMSFLKKQNISKRTENNYIEVYARAGDSEKNLMDKEDIMYISTKKGASGFIPLAGMNKEKIIDILVRLDKDDSLEIKSTDPDISKRLAAANEGKYRRRRMEIIPENFLAADIIRNISDGNDSITKI